MQTAESTHQQRATQNKVGHRRYISTNGGFWVVFLGPDCWCISISRNDPTKNVFRTPFAETHPCGRIGTQKIFGWVGGGIDSLIGFAVDRRWCQPCQCSFHVQAVYSHSDPTLWMIQTADRNAITISASSMLNLSSLFLFLLLFLCWLLFFIGSWQAEKVVVLVHLSLSP